MIPSRFSPSTPKPAQTGQSKESGAKPAGPHAATPPAQEGARASGASLKRVDSLPARLPSQTPQRAEVKPIRNPITRPTPDTTPPKSFEVEPPKIFGIPLNIKSEEGRIVDAAREKMKALSSDPFKAYVANAMSENPEYREIAKDYIKAFSDEGKRPKGMRVTDFFFTHPKFRAEMAKARNELCSIPSGPTGSRMMDVEEQFFLTKAFKRIQDDVREKPFHIHGESAMIGDQHCQVKEFTHKAGQNCGSDLNGGDRFHLHTHPPFDAPFDASASNKDHLVAADVYQSHGVKTYVTNGKDVLQIMPNSTELIKLNPDPKVEEVMGKFPVAFKVPDPLQPPYPFSNHEAPVAYQPWEGPTPPVPAVASPAQRAASPMKPTTWPDDAMLFTA